MATGTLTFHLGGPWTPLDVVRAQNIAAMASGVYQVTLASGSYITASISGTTGTVAEIEANVFQRLRENGILFITP